MVYSRGGGNGALSGRSPVTLCVPCADKDPLIRYRTSAAWDRKHETAEQGRRDLGVRGLRRAAPDGEVPETAGARLEPSSRRLEPSSRTRPVRRCAEMGAP